MKRRLCKQCREATGETWAARGVDGCVTCSGTFTTRRLADLNKQPTAGIVGGRREDGNADTNGWEHRR